MAPKFNPIADILSQANPILRRSLGLTVDPDGQCRADGTIHPPAPRHDMFAFQDKADDMIGEFMTPITGEEIRKQQKAGAIPRLPFVSEETDNRIRTEGAKFPAAFWATWRTRLCIR